MTVRLKTDAPDALLRERAHTVQVLNAEGRVLGSAPASMDAVSLVVELAHQVATSAAFVRLLDDAGVVLAVAPARAELLGQLPH